MCERADRSPVSSNVQTLPIKQLAARAVLARLGMASSCGLRIMKGVGFGQGVTGLAGMRGDTGRMAHPSGLVEPPWRRLWEVGKEKLSLWRQCVGTLTLPMYSPFRLIPLT